MADYEINIGGNAERSALAKAQAVDTLTRSIKDEEKALKSAQSALTKPASLNQFTAASKAANESSARIANMRRNLDMLKARSDSKPTKGFFDAIQASGGPIGGLIGNIRAAWGAMRENPSAAVAVSFAALAAVSISLGSRLLELAKDALTLGLGFADAARSARLLNEAADIAGGTHKQLGGIIEDVRKRSDIGRDRLSELGRELRLLRFDSRQTQITLSAMAVAESALGAGASGAVKGIAEQSRAMRRFSLGAMDAYREYESLKKIGLTKTDVFSELAKSTGKSVPEIQRQVQMGGVTITKGMAAIEGALRRKFGGTVQAQTLSLSSQFRRMKEDFEGLFSGSDMEPMLAALKSVSSIFSQDTASGRAFKEVVTRLLDDVGKTIDKLSPDIKEFFLDLGASASKEGGLAETVRGWIQDAKDLGKELKDVAEAIKSIGSAAKTVGDAFSWSKEAVTTHADQGELDAINKKLAALDKADSINAQLKSQGKAAGQALTAGVVAGVDAGKADAVGSITGLAQAMQAAFKGPGGIDAHSPSRAFERAAKEVPRGIARGADGSEEPARAVQSVARGMMGAMPDTITLAGSGSSVVYHIDTLNVMVPSGKRNEFERELRFAAEAGV